jgi:hypothetical protein
MSLVVDGAFSFKVRVKCCFKFVSVACLRLVGQPDVNVAQKFEPVKWIFHFESGALVIACTIGHLEQGITFVRHTRVASGYIRERKRKR